MKIESLLVAAAVILGLFLAAPELARADTARVVLQGGGLATGEVVVYIPGERITIRGSDGQTYTFEAAQIESVTIGEPAPAAPVVPPAPVVAQPPAANTAALQAERTRLANSRISLGGPIAVLSIGTVFMLTGAITLAVTPYDYYSSYRSGGEVAGITLMSLGGVLMLWGLPWTIKRGVKRGQTRRRINEIDRQLRIGLWTPGNSPTEFASYGAMAHFTW